MQQLILSHKSALWAIRNYRTCKNWSNIHYKIDEVLNNHTHASMSKIDLLIKNKTEMHNNSKINYHIQAKHLPRNSLFTLSDKYYCSCPELIAIQMSQKFSFENLCLLILEFCGNYHIDTQSCKYIQDEKSVTNINKIIKYVKKYAKLNPYAHGVKKIKSATDFCEDNSASPMESRMFIKLAGPRSKGFYGCKNLRFNIPITLSDNACKIAGQSYVIPDLSCASKKVAIEYDSAEYHENSNQGQKDKRRRDALVSDGWTVFSIVPQQLYNPQIFDVIARKILKALNQDYRIRVKNFDIKRNEAFQKLQ